MYNTTSIISTQDTDLDIDSFFSKTSEFIQLKNPEQALLLLNQIERALETSSVYGTINFKYLIFVLANKAYCYKLLHNYYNCILYVEAAIDTLLSRKICCQVKPNLEFSMFVINLRLSLCALQSHTEHHSAALKSAKQAQKAITKLTEEIVQRNRVMPTNKKEEETLQAFRHLLNHLQGCPKNTEGIALKNAPWAESCSLTEILDLKTIPMDNLSNLFEQGQASNNDIFAKLVIQSVAALYCIANELIILRKDNMSIPWITKSLKVSEAFLPKSKLCRFLTSSHVWKVRNKSITNSRYGKVVANPQKKYPLNQKRVKSLSFKPCKVVKSQQSSRVDADSFSYFERTVGIVVTSSDLYGDSDQYQCLDSSLFDSFGYKIV